ncbi:SMI1/KNR4 family protein [Acinetobacter gerneri]|uniref:SMI1/KNR4 family protein n=1 Tax=Acinetobacter gerneri TaxID=202952 RepID=UPI0028A5D5B0|nr:SMI1/KNR4 family protein [Acinetobacter gerneri]
MQNNLQCIEQWLSQHAAKIKQDSLNPPATLQQLNELEQLIKQPLPEDFKAIYLWHNGLNDDRNLGNLFYAMDFFPIEQVIEQVQQRVDMVDQLIALHHADPEIDAQNVFNPLWIKFAFDGGETGLYLDLAPSASGKVGQVIFIDDEYEIGLCVADSIQTLIADFANDLERDLYSLDEDALEDENEFLICDDRIDIINWSASERWKRPSFE